MKDLTIEFKRKQRNMSDDRLMLLCEREITTLAKTSGSSHKMTIPPEINDTDVLLDELLRRYKCLKNSKVNLLDHITTQYIADKMTAEEIVDLIGGLMDLVNLMKPTVFADLNNCSLTTVYNSKNLRVLGGQRFVFDPE